MAARTFSLRFIVSALAVLGLLALGGGSAAAATVDEVAVDPDVELSAQPLSPLGSPGATIPVNVTFKNVGGRIEVDGRVNFAGALLTTTTVKSWYITFDAKGANGSWTTVGVASGVASGYTPRTAAPSVAAAQIELSPNSSFGVTYPSGPDQITGTRIDGFPSASWIYKLRLARTPSQLSALLNSTTTPQVRVRYHAEGKRSGLFGIQTDATEDASGTFGQMLRSQNANASNAAVTVRQSGQPDQTIGAGTVPALSSVAPGSSVTVNAGLKLPAVAPRGSGESEAAYVSRLRSAIAAQAQETASATFLMHGSASQVPLWPLPDLDPPYLLGSSRPGTATAPAGTAGLAVPILEIAKSGPTEAVPGESASYSISVHNTGNGAGNAAVTDNVQGIGASTLTGFGSVAAGSSKTGSHSVSVPNGFAGTTISDTATVTWTDAAGNNYGPLTAGAVTPLRQDTTPPSAPTFNSVPATLTPSRDATFSFTGEDGGRFECSIEDATPATCLSPKALGGLADGSHVFAVRQIDDAGNIGSWAAYTWVVDGTAPNTPTVTARPLGSTSEDSASIEFSGEPGGTYECSLDSATFATCASPTTYTGLTDGSHEVLIRQRDAAGNTGSTAAVNWIVDRVAPVAPVLAYTPPAISDSGSAGFGFTGEAGGHFECSLDSSEFATCTNPTSYTALSDGERNFRVRQVDAAGNAGAAVLYEWRIDTAAPAAPSITDHPDEVDGARDSHIAFDGEGGAEFECSIDGSSYVTCASPYELTNLADGAHEFKVRQRDEAGNVGDPAIFEWSVASDILTAPEFAAHPDELTNSTDAEFTFTADPGEAFECKLDDMEDFLDCPSTITIGALVDGPHELSVRQVVDGQRSAASTFHWVVDATGPQEPPVFTSYSDPNPTTNHVHVEWLPSDEATMECTDETFEWHACESPWDSGPLEPGGYFYGFRWVDELGNVGYEQYGYWTISEPVRPDAPTISSAPSGLIADNTATVEFTIPEGTTAECSLDGTEYAYCESPWSVGGLADGDHVFSVRSVSSEGISSSVVSAAWSVDVTPPDAPVITAAPTTEWAFTKADLSFTGEDGARFYCKLDGGAFRTCSSPVSYGLLAQSAHHFEVKQVDAAGHVSETAAADWTTTVSPETATPEAPDLEPNGVSAFADQVSFLYEGSEAIQDIPNPEVIKDERVSVLRGEVQNTQGEPVAGVRVSVVDHPEFGVTQSRDTGEVYMAVNGGGRMTIRFEAPGAPPVDRVVNVPWRDYAFFDKVVITPYDPIVSQIDLGESTDEPQVAESSTVVDAAGARTSSVIFPAGVTAQMTMPDGSSSPINDLNVRISEFTVGESGPDAMPAPLPATTAYTYAADYSVDEAVAAGATGVRFSEPVYAVVDNFRNFPTDFPIPQGYYDYEAAQWKGEPDGRVMKVSSIENGSAVFEDADGNVVERPATGELGASAWDEISHYAATRFEPGDTFWLVPMNHFSTYDFNNPGGSGGDEGPPDQDDGDHLENNPCIRDASIVECENQTLGERVEIPGTDMSLNYRSDRAPGRVASSGRNFKISGASVPDDVESIEAFVRIAGKTYHRSFSPQPNLHWSFKWDGRDWADRPLTGTQQGTLEIEYVYPGFYRLPFPREDLPSWASVGVGGEVGAAVAYGLKYHVGRGDEFEVEAPPATDDRIMQSEDVAGWSLSSHDRFDPKAQSTIRGDGTRAHPDELDVSMSRTAGLPYAQWPENQGGGDDGGPQDTMIGTGMPVATTGLSGLARMVLKIPPLAAVGAPDNNDPDGIGDGGPATAAKIRAGELVVAPDGSTIYRDYLRIRRISPDGVITTIAGDGIEGPSGDGGPAIESRIGSGYGLALDASGNIYFGDGSIVRKIDRRGIVTRFAGNGDFFYDTDGPSTLYRDDGPARESNLGRVRALAVSPADGMLYIAADGNYLVHRVTPDGRAESLGDRRNPTHENVWQYDTNARALAISRTGMIYVGGQSEHGYVYELNPSTFEKVEIANLSGQPAFDFGYGTSPTSPEQDVQDLAVTNDGRLYINGGEKTWDYGGGHYHYEERLFIWNSRDGLRNIPVSDTNNTGVQGLATDANGVLHLSVEDGVLTYGPTFTDHLDSSGTVIPSSSGETTSRFDGAGRHIETRSARTNAVLRSFEYDPENRLTAVVDGFGNRTTIERDNEGDPTAIVAPRGQRTELSVDSHHLLHSIVEPGGATTLATYDGSGLMESFKKPGSGTSHFEYDADGRLVRDENAIGGFLSLTRSGSSSDYAVDISNGRGHSGSNRVERLTDGSTRRTLESAAHGTITKTDLPDGGLNRSGPLGSWNTANSPDGRFGAGVKTPAGETMTTPSGLTASSTKTDVFNLEHWWDPSSWTSRVTATESNGGTATTTYDKDSRSLVDRSPLGRETVTRFDDQLHPLSIEKPGLAEYVFGYDSFGRLSSQSTGDREMTVGYDERGNVAALTDAIGRTTQYVYDAADRLVEQQMPGGRSISFSYDAAGNVASIAPPSRPAHETLYDIVGRKVAVSLPDLAGSPRQTTFEYQGSNNELTKVTRPSGRTQQFQYDSAGRVESLHTVEGTTQFEYDDDSGKVASASSADGQTSSLTYDGPLLTSVVQAGVVSGEVTVSYDNSFRPEQISALGHTTSLSYDSDSMLVSAGDLSVDRASTTGLTSGTNLGNTTSAYTYNAYGEPLSAENIFPGEGRFNETYVRDQLGRVTEKTTQTADGTDRYSYTYDDAGRLTSVARNGNQQATYEYDANSNRTLTTYGEGSEAETRAATFDARDRMTAYGNLSLSYDEDGELIEKHDTTTGDSTTYSYATDGALSSAETASGVHLDYAYDAFGKLVARKQDGQVTDGFIYAPGIRGPVAQLGSDGNPKANFVYATGRDVPDYMVAGGQAYRVITDQIGSVRMIVNADTGHIEQEIEYDAFGRVVADSNPGFQPFGFAGGIYDRETKLTHFGAREYDADLGRWTTSDPSGFGGGDGNLYGYVIQDPVNLVDPAGEKGNKPFRPNGQPEVPGPSVGGGGGGGGWNVDCSCYPDPNDPYNLSINKWKCGSDGDGPETDDEQNLTTMPMPEYPSPGWGPGFTLPNRTPPIEVPVRPPVTVPGYGL